MIETKTLFYLSLTLLAGALITKMVVHTFFGKIKVFFILWIWVVVIVFSVFLVLFNQL